MLETRAIGAHRGERSARVRQLRLGLQHVGLGNHARGVAVLRDLQRALEAFDRAREQLGFEVGLAQREVVARELAFGRQARRRDVGGARLLARARALDGAADAAPEVRRPVAVERDAVARPRPRRRRPGDAPAVAAADLVRVARERDGGEVRGARLADDRLRLAVRRDGAGDRLVGGVDLAREAVELRVVEQAPPVAAIERVGGRSGQPERAAVARRLLVRSGRGRLGTNVVRAGRAAGDDERNERRPAPHVDGSGATVGATSRAARCGRRSLSSST